MTEQFLRKAFRDYLEHHGLTEAPCASYKNFCVSNRPPINRCTKFDRSVRQKYFCPDAPKCPEFEKGECQINIIDDK